MNLDDKLSLDDLTQKITKEIFSESETHNFIVIFIILLLIVAPSLFLIILFIFTCVYFLTEGWYFELFLDNVFILLLIITNIFTTYAVIAIRRFIYSKLSFYRIRSRKTYHSYGTLLSNESKSKLDTYLFSWRHSHDHVPHPSNKMNALETLCDIYPELSSWLDNHFNDNKNNDKHGTRYTELYNLVGHQCFNQHFHHGSDIDKLNNDVQIESLTRLDALYVEHLDKHLSKITLEELHGYGYALKDAHNTYIALIAKGVNKEEVSIARIVQRKLHALITKRKISELGLYLEAQQLLNQLNSEIEWTSYLSQVPQHDKASNAQIMAELIINKAELSLLDNVVAKLLILDKHNPSMNLLCASRLEQYMTSTPCRNWKESRLVFALRDYERHVVEEIVNSLSM